MSRYYPLVDADSGGQDKVPLFPCDSITTVFASGDFALAEVSRHQYTLLAMTPHTESDYRNFHIHCPLCGRVMNIIKPHRSSYLLAEYACENNH